MNGKAQWLRVSWMAAALLPLVAGLASAVNPTVSGTNQPNQQDRQVASSPAPSSGQTAFQPKLDRAKDLIGAKVMNDKGEQLGTVADIVLTPNRDAVNYVVLSHGGTWGTASKYFAVPWSQFGFQAGENGKILILKDVSKAQLDQAPGFDKNHWPATASENWLSEQRSLSPYPNESAGRSSAQLPPNGGNQGVTAENGDQGLFTAPASGEYATPGGVMTREPPSASRPDQSAVEPGRGSSPNTGRAETVNPEGTMPGHMAPGTAPIGIDQLRLSKLLGTTVQDRQGQDIGKLGDAMIDVQQGKLAFGIVSFRSGFLGLNKDYAPVPWSALDLASQPGIAKLNADRETLMAVAASRDNFPNLQNPQYSRELYARFHVTPYWEGQNLGFIPGEEQNVNPPSSSRMTAPNATAPNYIAHHMEQHGLAWNPNAVETIHGKITSVGTYKVPDTSMEGVLLHVKTDAGRTMRVYVGPRSFVDSHNVSFHKGDAVTITGSVAKTGHRETILASQIQTANRTLDLRTPDGQPLWNLNQSRSPSASRSYDQYRNTYAF
jgi:sporulation protein YlmC with PRC-barrel domain